MHQNISISLFPTPFDHFHFSSNIMKAAPFVVVVELPYNVHPFHAKCCRGENLMWWDIFIGFSKLRSTKVERFLCCCKIPIVSFSCGFAKISGPGGSFVKRVTNFLNFVDWIWTLNRPFYLLWLKSERNILIIQSFSNRSFFFFSRTFWRFLAEDKL